MKKIINTLVVLMAVLTMALPVDALQIDLNYEFSEATSPQNSQPPSWLKAVFENTSPGVVTLTMTAQNLAPGEFISEWSFNLNPIITDYSSMVIAFAGGQQQAAAITSGPNVFKADGDGFFDILFEFPTSAANRFIAGETSVYTFTYPGLTDAAFNFGSAPGGGAGTYKSAAHVQGIGTGGNFSGWIGNGDGSFPIPEPATMLLLGLGLLGLGIVVRKRS